MCRKNGDRISLVSDVRIGDVVHMYYIFGDKNPKRIGRFTVVHQADHKHPELFGGHIDDLALAIVKDPSFIDRNDPHKDYEPDTVLKVFTGWLLRHEGEAMIPPKELLEKLILEPSG